MWRGIAMEKEESIDDLALYGGSLYLYLEKNRPDLCLGCKGVSKGDSDGALAHGTTIVALKYDSGVIIGADRQVTSGYTIVGYREKIYDISDHCAMAVSGTVAVSEEIAKHLFLEVTHYGKINHIPLSVNGIVNTLSRMIRANSAAAMQGMVCVPLLAAFDKYQKEGKVFNFDTLGSVSVRDYATSGSGGGVALVTIQDGWDREMGIDRAVSLAVKSLIVAGRNDAGTTAVDISQGIYPVVKVIDAKGLRDLDEEAIKGVCTSIMDSSHKPMILGRR
jgi:proteasome beta subunit